MSLSPKNLRLTAEATARESVSKAPSCYLNRTRRRPSPSSVTNWQLMRPNTAHCLLLMVELSSHGLLRQMAAFFCVGPKRGDRG